jgi:hypothetical protein
MVIGAPGTKETRYNDACVLLSWEMAGAARAERTARMFDLFMVCLLFSKSLSFAVLVRVERVVICEK